MSLTSSLYTAYSGANASQVGLTVTSGNMTNANTQGYTRQRVTTSGIYAPTTYSTFNVGGGVQVQDIQQITNQMLRENCRSANSDLGYYDTQEKYLYQTETAYGDPFGYTTQTATEDYMNAWEELSKDPSDQAARASVYETGVAFSDSVADYNNQIDAIEQSAIDEVEDTVAEINAISNSLSAINNEVTKYPAGDVPLELLDQREQLLDDLALLTDCTAIYQPDGTVDVLSNNGMLVSGTKTNTLQSVPMPPDGNPEVQWSNGMSYNNEGGSLGALTSLLDPSNDPSFEATRKEYNDGIMSIVNEINTLHAGGTGLNGETGLDFFVPVNPDLPLSPENMCVNPELEDVNKIAASVSGAQGDGDNAYAISELQNSQIVTTDSGTMTMEEFFASYTQKLGSQTKDAQFLAESQKELQTQFQTQLDSVTAVSTDDELANMMMYQQTYNANINVMNMVDELIGNMIEELG